MKDNDIDIKKYNQLLEQIEALEQENNFLANRAEEILLLSLLSETIALIEDESLLIEELLEKVSILRNIPFCSCFAKTVDGYHLIADYFVGELPKEALLHIVLPEDVKKELSDCHVFCELAKDCELGFLSEIPIEVSEEPEVLIIPFESVWVKEGVFIFISNNEGQDIKESILIVQQAIRVILDKIDKITYIKKIEYLNQSLESKVEQRTKDLFEINTKLIEEINERHAVELELRKARDKAMESDRLKSAFLANMSHEIRTPMNAIVGFSELLANQLCNDEDIQYYTNLIYSNSISLLNLINDLLDFSKIEANQLVIRKRMCSLNAILDEIKALGESMIVQYEKHSMQVVVENCCRNGEVMVFTDDLRLKQILMNLVSNAIKFSFEGKVIIRHYVMNDEFYYFEVCDNGIGIAKEQHELIFNRFTRVYDNINKPILGNGLGLTITKNLVEMLGGKITVDSVLGEGAVFRFYIDIKERID